MSISIHVIADFFITKVDESSGDPMTHLKLQKLAYYAQAWHLTLLEEPLVKDDFEAWIHGPVAKELYDRFNGNGWNPIALDQISSDPSELDERTQEFLGEVWDVYGQYTAKALEEMTHEEEPWLTARDGVSPIERSNQPISVDIMKSYYGKVLEEYVDETATN